MTSKEDDLYAKLHGWALFDAGGVTQLQALDDPDAVEEDLGRLPTQIFVGRNRDKAAAAWVQQRALEGDAVCRRAIETLIAEGSPDVALFGLEKTW